MRGFAVLCPGQGDQGPAMFDPVRGEPEALPVLDAFAEVLGERPEAMVRRAGLNLSRNLDAQPLVVAASLTAWSALRGRLPTPLVFAGYSVGELSACACAGAIRPADAARLARLRAQLMEAASREPAGMLGVRGIPRGRLAHLCRECGAEISIVNGADHCIVAGTLAAIQALEARLGDTGGADWRRLPITVASHTSLMGEAAEAFAAQTAKVVQDSPRPVLEGVSGRILIRGADIGRALAAQLDHTINWEACLVSAWEMGARIFLELGPGEALSRMVRELLGGAEARSVADFKHLDGAAQWVHSRL